MESFLSGVRCRYLLFPLVSVGLGVWVKYVTRNDQYAKFRKEDLAVGLEVFLTACLMFVLLTTERATSLLGMNRDLNTALHTNPIDMVKVDLLQTSSQNISNTLATSGWIILFMVLGLWGISTLVRKLGWKSESELKSFTGIGIRLVMGILALLTVMAGVTQ